MEGAAFILGSLVFLGVLAFCLMRVFALGPREEAAQQSQEETGRVEILEVVAARVRFRVVGGRGECPLGVREGDLVTMGPAATFTPELCPPTEAVLRLAAAADGRTETQELWCCPIFEHQLVFRQLAVGEKSRAA